MNTVTTPVVAALVAMLVACATKQDGATVQPQLERFTAASVSWRQFEIAKELAAHRDGRALIALAPLLRGDDRAAGS